MTNAERLLRELRQSGRRGCTHRELEGAGVSYVSVEIGRLEARGAVIRTDHLPVSGQRRFVLIREPDVERAAGHSSEGTHPTAVYAAPADSSLGTGTLFDLPPVPVTRSPYDTNEEAA